MSIVTAQSLTNGMDEKQLREAVYYAELENSNLRKLLLWCAERIPKSDVPILARKLREPTTHGGVTESVDDETARKYRNFCTSAAAAAEMLEQYLEGECDEGVTPTWRTRAHRAVELIRTNALPRHPGSLAFLREVTGVKK